MTDEQEGRPVVLGDGGRQAWVRRRRRPFEALMLEVDLLRADLDPDDDEEWRDG